MLKECILKDVQGVTKKIFELNVTEARVYRCGVSGGEKIESYADIKRCKGASSVRFEIYDREYISILIDLKTKEFRLSTASESKMLAVAKRLGVDFSG